MEMALYMNMRQPTNKTAVRMPGTFTGQLHSGLQN